jgi:hypothetical protein
MLEHVTRPAGWRRLIASVGALALGAFVGSVTTVAHQNDVDALGVAIPWGMILGLVAITGFLVGLRIVTQDRIVVLAASFGIVGMIFLLSMKSPGGSVLVPNNLWGTVWAIAPALVATIVTAWPKLPERPRGATKPAASSH